MDPAGEGPTSSRPLRVLHVVSTFEIKTDTKILELMLPLLDRGRVEPSIACMYGGGPMRNRFEALGIPTRDFQAAGELNPFVVRRIARWVGRNGFDAVHTHLLRADLYAGLAARLARTRAVVSTVHALGEFRRSRKRRLDGLLDQLSRLWPTHWVAVSHAVKADAVKRLRRPGSWVTVIHNGIEPERFKPNPAERQRIRDEWQLDRDMPLIVVVARLSYEKGLPTLLQAASRLRRTHPKAVVAIVGDGPLRAELTDQINDSGLPDSVRLIGFRQDIASVLSAADVACLPSYMEGFPNALLEACAAELPVVATKVGGIPELVVAGRTGLLVEPHRPDELAEALERVLSEPELARQLGRAARERIETHFTARHAARRHEELYERLLMTKQTP